MFRSFSFRASDPLRAANLDVAARPPRIAVIDIGSNSVRMVVYESVTRSPTVLFNEKALCGLGDALQDTGRLAPEGRDRAMRALTRYAALAEKMNVSEVGAVGTAALRDAEDGPEFVAEVRSRLGLEIEVASGADEARLAAQGVILGDPFAEGVVADMGGASMELVQLTRENDGPPQIASGVTTRLGPLRLKAIASQNGLAANQSLCQGGGKTRKAVESAIDTELKAALERSPLAPGQALYLLGGSWRALARAWMTKTNYPLQVLHEFALDKDAAYEMGVWGAGMSVQELKELTGVSESRARVTPYAALSLSRLVAQLKPSRVSISAFGLREGVLWERMPEALKAQDPLIDACRAIEASDSRSPGFGAELWAWLSPLLAQIPVMQATGLDPRCEQAACLLADAVWRTHPDYRGQASFELVTRNNFGGVDHRGRMFIAAALVYRFKGAKRAIREMPGVGLLDATTLSAAEALGRGMRLGAVLTGATAGQLPNTRLELEDDALRLTLEKPTAALAGEEVGRRLQSFAEALRLAGASVEAES